MFLRVIVVKVLDNWNRFGFWWVVMVVLVIVQISCLSSYHEFC